MVEHASNGPILLHSFLNPTPENTFAGHQNSTGTPKPLVDIGGFHIDDGSPVGTNVARSAQQSGESDDVEDDANGPPLLLSTVITHSSDSVREARRAAARLERIGKQVQGQLGLNPTSK